MVFPDADRLARQLSHRFQDAGLLECALTHSSYGEGGANYERLEFLGDRVLGLVVADMLYRHFPAEPEGALAKRLTALVQQAALVRVATALSLQDCLRLSPGEKKTGGPQKETILADAVEALIGALYLDGGLSAARDFIELHWRGMLDMQAAPPQDPKTQLQEWAQARGLPLPEYALVGQEGAAHNPRFTIAARLQGRPECRATAASKRLAEKEAAAMMLSSIESEGL